MEKTDNSEGTCNTVFTTRKLEKCQSEENRRMIVSQFLGENLSLVQKIDLKMSRSLSPNALQRVIRSLPSSRLNSTSLCSLSLSPSPGQRRRNSPLRSLDTILGLCPAAPSTSSSSSSRPSSPSQLSFLGQIYRHSIQQREGKETQQLSKFDK